MAVARPQMKTSLTGVHYALIAFVAATVASWVGTIWLYTHQEELNQRVSSAESGARSANEKASQAQDKYGTIMKLLTGNPELEAEAVEQQVNQIRGEVAKTPGVPNAASFAQMPIVSGMRQLAKMYGDRTNQAAALQAESEKQAKAMADLEGRVQQQISQFTGQATELQGRFEELKKSHGDTEAKWEQNVKTFEASLNELKDKNTERLNTAQAEINKLKSDSGEKQSRINTLVQSLEKFRPSQDPMAVLKDSDGKVLRVLPEESVAYINLGKKDRVTPGLTFAVYSPLGGVDKEGKGKGTLEVVNVMSDASECRITGMETGNNIIEGDLIANPVYDKNRRFTFAVAGDFDLNFDEIIDDPGGNNVKKLITGWGGRVVDTVDEQTDFVVLGKSPQAVVAKAATPEAEDAARIRNADKQKLTDAFNGVKTEAKALDLPILTRTQFLHFIGYQVPKNTTPDEPI